MSFAGSVGDGGLMDLNNGPERSWVTLQHERPSLGSPVDWADKQVRC
jgi:hypothetical protein